MSNFYPCPIKITHNEQELEFPTSEHLYQWSKHYKDNPTVAKQIRTAPSAASAKKLGRTPCNMKEFDKHKIRWMKRILELKLEQHPSLKEKLLATGDEDIEEFAPWDNFWGMGKQGEGQNWMGKLWMELREETRKCK